jgi:hypothetical protein
MHADLLLSPSALWRAVAVYELCERFGGRSRWEHLTASHLKEVLSLDGPDQERLLNAAQTQGWSVSRLRAEVIQQRSKGERRARRVLLKHVRNLKKTLTARRFMEAATIGQLDSTTEEELRETMTLLQERLECFHKLLGESDSDQAQP